MRQEDVQEHEGREDHVEAGFNVTGAFRDDSALPRNPDVARILSRCRGDKTPRPREQRDRAETTHVLLQLVRDGIIGGLVDVQALQIERLILAQPPCSLARSRRTHQCHGVHRNALDEVERGACGHCVVLLALARVLVLETQKRGSPGTACG